MEEFAAQIAASGTSESIAQVYDQYLNFIVGEPDLFSLAMGRETYWALNSAQAEDEVLDSVIERTVIGLFSVVVTMGKSCRHRIYLWFFTKPNARGYTHHTMS